MEFIRVERINPTKSLIVSDIATKGKMEALDLFLAYLSHQYTQVATYHIFNLLFLLLLATFNEKMFNKIDLDVGKDRKSRP